MATNVPQAYQQSQVNTAKPGELTLLLYNELVKSIRYAKNAIGANNIEKANSEIKHAQDVISELVITLNMQFEIAQQLNMLYDYLQRRLVEANIKKNTDILAEVEGFAVDLRNTWAQALKSV